MGRCIGLAKAKILNNKEKMPRLTYLRSILRAVLFALIIMVVVAALITFTSLSEAMMPMVTSIIMILSIAFSGLLSARQFKNKGFIHGIVTGAIYILLIMFLSWIFIRDFSIDKFNIIKGVIGIVSGGIGGMIGVNLK
jgi:putative membrane protein (TIGR04086 family)